MTTPPAQGRSGPWATPEHGGDQPAAPGGWGPAPGAPVPPGGPAPTGGPVVPGAAAPGATPPGQGWGQLSGGQPSPYGSVLSRRGIIALKPLGFGDFFDGSFRAIRHNPKVMIGLSAVVLVVTNVLVTLPLVGVVSTLGLDGSAEPTDEELVGALGSLVALVPTGFLQAVGLTVLTGMLILSVSQSIVDRRLGVGELWARARGRVLALIGWSLLQSLATALLVALALAPGVVLLVLEEYVGGALALGLLGLGLVALLAWLYVALAFVPVVIVVERLGVIAAVRRSASLVKGAFWRTLGVLLLTAVLASIVSQLLSTPFGLLGSLGLGLAGSDPVLGGVIYAVAVSLGSTLGLLLAVPFLAAVVSLLYVDRRIRLEGLDVSLARTLEDETA